MKGGFNNPPNRQHDALRETWESASMKGGFNNPPNLRSHGRRLRHPTASMKGGFNNPPNEEVEEEVEEAGGLQ